MAYEITNTLRSRSVVRVTGNTATRINLSQLSVNTQIETVETASINHIITSTDGVWRIYRGNDASGVLIFELFDGADLPLNTYDISVANAATSNIYVTNSGTGGTLILSVTKQATYTPALEGM